MTAYAMKDQKFWADLSQAAARDVEALDEANTCAHQWRAEAERLRGKFERLMSLWKEYQRVMVRYGLPMRLMTAGGGGSEEPPRPSRRRPAAQERREAQPAPKQRMTVVVQPEGAEAPSNSLQPAGAEQAVRPKIAADSVHAWPGLYVRPHFCGDLIIAFRV